MITQELLSNETRLGGLVEAKHMEALKALTPEQVAAVTALSEKDESNVIAAKTKDIHDQYDRDIKDITGKDKPGGVKSYDHLKQLYNDYKQVADNATEEVTRLKEQIKGNSGDKELKAQLKAAETKLADREGELNALKTQYETEKAELDETLKSLQKEAHESSMSAEFASTISGVALKTTIPEEDREQALQFAQNKLMSTLKRDQVEEGGKSITVFRGADNQILRNPDNSNKPYTAGELLLKEVGWMVDGGRKKEGGGTGAAGGNARSTVLNMNGVKTKVQADDLIMEHIVKVEGIARATPEFTERHTELRKEHNVDELPVRESLA